MTRVVLMMTDGMRPDGFKQANTPNLDQFLSESSYTLEAQSVMPSITLPCHMSIFHSIPPNRHGITSNDWHPMARPIPGLLERAKYEDKRCGLFLNWEQLRDLGRPGNLHYLFMRDSSYYYKDEQFIGDEFIAEAAIRDLPTLDLNFAFVYWGTIDTVGHAFGWMSDEYIAQIERVDSLIGDVLSIIPSDTTVLIQSDHGGHDRNHGTDSPEDMTIPWMIRGNGIRQGHQIQQAVSLLDTAPTIAKIMKIKPAPEWEGKIVAEIFEE